MNASLFYFSGTGNSLAVARDISGKINGTLIPIQNLIKEESIKVETGIIGIVFPVYHGGLPLIIKRFVEKLECLDKKYIFGVCTHGGSPGLSLKYLGKMILKCGGKLSAGFAVNMPYNYITPSFVFKDFLKSFTLREVKMEKQEKLFSEWKGKLEILCSYISLRKENKYETGTETISRFVDFFDLHNSLGKAVWLKIAGFKGKTELSFWESIRLMDYGFSSDDKCSSCGICSKVCPVGNIEMKNGLPHWLHRCEQCFACLQWCPEEALQFGVKTHGQKRYHHPEVKLSEILMYNKTNSD